MAERKPRKPKLRLDVQPGQHGLPASALGPKSGLTFVQAYFPLAKSVLRIATGYFTVKGYNIGLENLTSPDVLLHFLVGPKEGKNARDAVAQRIRLELRSGTSGNLVAAVEDLIERIKAGKFVIQDTREVSQMFHCKFYICDEEYVWHGSANFTENGLLRQAEQVEVSTDSDLIRRWLTWFQEVANQSRNIMTEVLAELEA